MFIRVLFLIVSTSFYFVAGAQAGVMIDDFTAKQSVKISEGTEIDGVNGVNRISGNMIGRSRLMTVTAEDNGDIVDDGHVSIKANPTKGGKKKLYLSLDNDPSVDGVVTIRWDGGEGSAGLNGGLGVDLTDNGMFDQLVLNMLIADSGMKVEFTLKDIEGVSATGSIAFNEDIMVYNDPRKNLFGIRFDDFKTSDGVGDLDEEKIILIEMKVTGKAGWDGTIGYVESGGTVPEPSSIALLGLGGTLLILRGRRRKSATTQACPS